MIALDCLLKNTQIEKNLRKWVEKRVYQNAAEGKDASVHAVFNELHNNGVEVSLRAVGQIYADAAFPVDGPFTSHAEIHQITGRRFEDTLRNLLMMKPKDGTVKMGREALGEHIAGTVADAFYNDLVQDNTGKSTMVQLRDTVMAATKRLLGETPNKNAAPTKEEFLDTVKRYVDQENNVGYDTLEGKMNNIHDVMRETLQEFKRYHQGLAADPAKQALFAEHIKDVETALNSVLFSRKDAGNVIDGVLKDAGYMKTLKDGREIKDWDKLAGSFHDIRQLKANVRDAMENAGYASGTAMRIADSLGKEYIDLHAKALDTAERKFAAREANLNNPSVKLPRVDITDMIDKRVAEWENYKKLAGDDTKRITFGKKEARDIVISALKQEGYGKELPNGTIALNWTMAAREIKNNDMLRNAVIDRLTKEGYSNDVSQKIASAIHSMYRQVRQEIVDHAHDKLTTMQDSIGAPRTGARTELARLAELHDLGIFKGGFDRLLNDRLGVDSLTQRHMDQLRDIGKKVADLTIELKKSDGGMNLTKSYPFSVLQREIEHILGENRDNRTRLMKMTKLASNIMSLGNVGILSNPYNISENTLSGQQMLASIKGVMTKEMGLQAAKGFTDRKLWWQTLFDVAKGGVEYGDAGEKIAHISDFSKNLNTLNFKKSPLRALGTAAILVGRTGLNGMDAANKAVAHKWLGILALHQTLVKQHGMTRDEASQFLHEALYGQNFDDAKVQAGSLLTQFGLKNNEATRTRFANDIVKANLMSEGLLSPEIIEAAHNSAFHVASIGLGHEANNQFSRMIHQGKVESRQRENEHLKNGDTYHAALERVMSNIWYNGMMRFAGGGANWAVLRMQNVTGHGIVTGLHTAYAGNAETLPTSPDEYERQMSKRLEASRRVSTGISELALASMGFAAFYAYGASQNDKGEDESTLETATRHAAGSYMANRVVNKVAPNMLQLYYLMKKSKGEGNVAAIDGTLKYLKNTFNIDNDHSVGGRIVNAGTHIVRGPKGYDQAMGDLGSILGEMYSTPFYRAGKNFGQIANYWATGDPGENVYFKPMSVADGVFGGGLLQDMGVYTPSAPIELLPGVGNKLGAKLREQGINTVYDLKGHEGWEHQLPKKYRDGAKKMVAELTHDNSGSASPGEE